MGASPKRSWRVWTTRSEGSSRSEDGPQSSVIRPNHFTYCAYRSNFSQSSSVGVRLNVYQNLRKAQSQNRHHEKKSHTREVFGNTLCKGFNAVRRSNTLLGSGSSPKNSNPTTSSPIVRSSKSSPAISCHRCLIAGSKKILQVNAAESNVVPSKGCSGFRGWRPPAPGLCTLRLKKT